MTCVAAAIAGVVSVWGVDAFAQESQASASPDPGELEVVVRGRVQPPASSRDPTAASTVIREDELRAPGASAADVIARAPGVQVQRTGAQSDLATASIRGASSAQTPVYLAGIRLNDDVTGTADLSTTPLWMLHRVEVFRGNAPEHADQLGLGGAIFLEPVLPRRSTASAGLMLGSFGAAQTWASGTLAGPDASTLLAIRRDGARNDYPYRNDRGTRFDSGDDRWERRSNADFVAYDAWVIGRYQLSDRARIVTVLSGFDREQGVTGLAVIPAERSRARVRRELAAVSSTSACPGVREERCRIELTAAALRARVGLADPWQELGLGSTRLDSQGRRIAQGVRVTHRWLDTLEVGVGASQSFESLRVARDPTTNLHADRDVTRLTVRAKWEPLSGVTGQVLGALEAQPTSGPEPTAPTSAVQPTGRVGTAVEPWPWLAVLGNVGSYVRWPTLGELYGTSPLVLGNAALTVERGTSYDLGLRAVTEPPHEAAFGGWVEVFGFRRDVSELIAYQRSSFRQIRPYNVGSATLQGVEAALGGAFLDLVQATTSITLLDPRDTTPDRTLANDILPYHSRLVLTSGIEFRVRPSWIGKPLSRLSVELRAMHRSSRHQNPAGLGPIPRHTTFDAEAVTQLYEGRLALRCLVSNLFDAEQFDVVGLPLPGRAAYGSVEATWW